MRLREIMRILRKHGLIRGITPEKLRGTVEDLGPTFVKLGQMMSMRQDLLPLAYCEELRRLRSDVKPMPEDEVRRVVELSLGMPLSEAFLVFDPQPLGSASIAQAHRAVLPTGERVVVKVQREGIHATMASDIALLRRAARLMRLTPTGETVDFNMVLDEMWAVSQQEMDFLNEAANIEAFFNCNRDVAYVACPQVYRGLSTREVLVMEAVDGPQIDDRAALEAAGYDRGEIARKLCVNYMKQILDDGFFHADPHPGNLRVRDGQIVWLDLGMMGRLSPHDRAAFQKAIAAAAVRDTGALTEAVLAISRHKAPVDRDALYADVDGMLSDYLEQELGAINLGEMLQRVLDLAQKHRLAMPPGVTMLGRGVSTLEGLIAAISPETNLMEIVSQRFTKNAFQELDVRKLLARDAQSAYESVQKSLSTPALLNDALRAALRGDLRLRVDRQSTQASEQARNLRLARLRRTMLLCACLLGASLTTLAPVEPRWLGLPWIAVAGYAAAGAAAVAGWWKDWRGR
ncbi:MAG: AarF/ABC1/UbiB kinase family protein [Clostridiales bacterium]|nr:AarF/ABC1/UbiB kinase family protein [Clostridiales bacterium]